MSQGTTYPLTNSVWPNEGLVDIRDVDGVRVCSFSIEFLRKGHVLDWSYILAAIHACVVERGVIWSAERRIVDVTSTPSDGQYTFVRTDDAVLPCAPTIGPRFQYKNRASAQGSDSGTMSASSASQVSGNQASFRSELLIRDGWCIVSDSKRAIACHILPQSRPEYYAETLGYVPSTLHEVGFGLLLTSTLHHSFDKGEFGFFPDPSDPSTLIVHVFHDPDMAQYHGKRIGPSRFRVKGPYEMPRKELLAFHYRQCLVKHARGYAFFPSS